MFNVAFYVVKSVCSADYECDAEVARMPECVFSEEKLSNIEVTFESTFGRVSE